MLIRTYPDHPQTVLNTALDDFQDELIKITFQRQTFKSSWLHTLLLLSNTTLDAVFFLSLPSLRRTRRYKYIETIAYIWREKIPGHLSSNVISSEKGEQFSESVARGKL